MAKSTFTQAIADKICERLSDGESLRSICLDDAIPSMATVFRWLADPRHSLFREQYALAREAQADALFEDIQEIADDSRNDWVEKRDRDNLPIGYELNGDHVRRSALRIDVRKWRAGKLKPKVYGDKTAIELSGHLNISEMTEDDLREEIARMVAEGIMEVPTERLTANDLGDSEPDPWATPDEELF